MPTNLELKAHLNPSLKIFDIIETLPAKPAGSFYQRDIYYKTRYGRLKLRITDNRKAELIYYKRKNIKGSKNSNYVIMPVSHYRILDKILRDTLGRLVIVQKERKIYFYKNCRIHIDSVRGLGKFLEFEVLVTCGKSQARDLMKFLIKNFNIKKKDILAESYSDMLLRKD